MSSFAVLGLATDELQSFIKGTHSDPFRILGTASRRATICQFACFVRMRARSRLCFHPERKFSPSKLHDDGFYQAILPGRKTPLRLSRARGALGRLANGRCTIRIATARSWARWIFIFSPKEIIGELYEKFGAHLRTIGDERGRLFRGLGAERAARQRGRRFQWLGWPRQSDAQTPRQRRLGIVSARRKRRRALQVRDPHAARRAAC